ncbi:MAG: OsmC family protein [Pseudomonadota bacterium]|nr:OsmC family protein [Pseudomonadota bacterium]
MSRQPSRHDASLTWSRGTPDFAYDTYDRSHRIVYGSGVTVTASSAVEFKGDPTKVNPEESFVGALSSCHMLTFLAIAARRRLVVDSYEDAAEGYLEMNAAGRLAMTRVILRPKVRFAEGVAVSAAALAELHRLSHENCFIAQSVTTDVTVEPA